MLAGDLPRTESEGERQGHRDRPEHHAEGQVDDLVRQTHLSQCHRARQHDDGDPRRQGQHATLAGTASLDGARGEICQVEADAEDDNPEYHLPSEHNELR